MDGSIDKAINGLASQKIDKEIALVWVAEFRYIFQAVEPPPTDLLHVDVNHRNVSGGRLRNNYAAGQLAENLLQAGMLEFQFSMERFAFLLRTSSLRDVDYYAPNADRSAVTALDRYHVPQPHDPSIGSDHSIFELMVFSFFGRIHAELRNPPVVRMNVLNKEVGLIQPLLGGITKDALGLLADEFKAVARIVQLPYDALDRINQRLILTFGSVSCLLRLAGVQ